MDWRPGERYDVRAKLIARAPEPLAVVTGIECSYQMVIAQGYGIADFCLRRTSSAGGSDAASWCRSVRFSLTDG